MKFMRANTWASHKCCHIWGWMCSRWWIHTLSFLCSGDIAVITQMAAINHGQMFQKTKGKARQLEEEASKRTIRAKKSSGCCLHPQDDWTFCWEGLQSPSLLTGPWRSGTQTCSRTLRWFYRKRDDREEALRDARTINSYPFNFLLFDRCTTSGPCCCCDANVLVFGFGVRHKQRCISRSWFD